MSTLTAAQVAELVKRVGFPNTIVGDHTLHVIMVAVCTAESNRREEVVNSIGCVGLFQINAPVHKKYDARRLKEGEYNTRAALDIYKSQGLRAWEAYTNGAYRKYTDEARRGVAQASSVTGTPSTTTTGSTSSGTASTPAVTYGALGPEAVKAGIGVPLVAAKETLSPLSPLKIFGSEIWADFSTLIVGKPTFEAGIETIPNLKFSIADPEGDLLFRHRNVFVRGARIQYLDLSMRLDTLVFEPGPAGNGQISITAIDDMVYALMKLQGAATASGQSAVSWLWSEMFRAGLSPGKNLLGEAVPTQSMISRDVPDQQGTTGSGQQPSAWTTMVRLAKELGKRFFVSGTRLVFGSSAFAMRWTAPGAIQLSRHALTEGEKWLDMPSAKFVTVGSRSDVLEVTGKVPLNRALFFRPGVPIAVRNTPAIAGSDLVQLMCSKVSYGIGTDVDGADITLLSPVDSPAEPPQSTTANSGSTSSGASVSGGGADGQIDRFVSLALQQAGDRYVFGTEASPSDPDPRQFDCSELVEWAAARAGISPKVPDGSAAQKAHCASHGTLISVSQGINTKGALLFAPGHVAISLGNGKTIEAMNPSQGVRQGNATTSRFNAAGKIPGAQGYR
jgi:cell wall-associated NlpC family hydrolase